MRRSENRHVQAIGHVIGLFAGRSAYRAAVAVSSLVLVDAWGAHEFGRYWTLVGSFLVLLPVTSWGIEKAALNLVPQAGAGLLPVFVRLCIRLCVLSLSLIGLLVLILPLADPGLFG